MPSETTTTPRAKYVALIAKIVALAALPTSPSTLEDLRTIAEARRLDWTVGKLGRRYKAKVGRNGPSHSPIVREGKTAEYALALCLYLWLSDNPPAVAPTPAPAVTDTATPSTPPTTPAT